MRCSALGKPDAPGARLRRLLPKFAPLGPAISNPFILCGRTKERHGIQSVQRKSSGVLETIFRGRSQGRAWPSRFKPERRNPGTPWRARLSTLRRLLTVSATLIALSQTIFRSTSIRATAREILRGRTSLLVLPFMIAQGPITRIQPVRFAAFDRYQVAAQLDSRIRGSRTKGVLFCFGAL
jgi:hypothetical protein